MPECPSDESSVPVRVCPRRTMRDKRRDSGGRGRDSPEGRRSLIEARKIASASGRRIIPVGPPCPSPRSPLSRKPLGTRTQHEH